VSATSHANTFDRFAEGAADLRVRLAARAGWRRAAVAAGLGVAATAALPPVFVLPLVILAFTGLVWLLEGVPAGDWRATRAASSIGWWFGFGHFVSSLYWLANALLLDAAQFGWMVPFAVFGLSALLAIFTAAAAAVHHRAGFRGIAGVLLFAVAWTAAEWLRGHVLTGFPWNLIGTVWADMPVMMQGTSLVGLYGWSLLTVIVAALPATLVASDSRSGARRWTGTALAAVLVLAGWAFGMARLPAGDAATVPDVQLRLVQPNVPQSLKWEPALRVQNFRKGIELTGAPGWETRTHVIWPETAVPFVLTDFNPEGPAIRHALASVTPPGGLLITGAPRAMRDAAGHIQLWNSLFAVDQTGAVVATYDKHHLVPFGEYVPLRPLFGTLVAPAGAIDFSAGPGPQTVALPGLPPASPLICYEAIFPGEVADAQARPSWLLNISNDAWFGMSAGPYQHFAAARFRAVEEGLPLVRSTNDGITAVVDPYGRVIASLALGQTGVVDAGLPRDLGPTLYARGGDFVPFGLGVMILLAVFLLGKPRPRWYAVP
jgi:apolipoprotein N-acyltransferase